MSVLRVFAGAHAFQQIADMVQQAVIDLFHLHGGRLAVILGAPLSSAGTVSCGSRLRRRFRKDLEAAAIKEHGGVGAVELNPVILA